ncbi:MAG TPA: hypothetical protein VGU22_10810 [Methylomirabilota bacterium]|jgi:hypothetical protein|nr:hypothetical protein [Methylomirabilota bacterium]
MEPFAPGESVVLTDTEHTLGHIVGVSADGGTVEVRWLRRPGHDHEVTRESTEAIRRVHESEQGMLG